MRELSHDQLMDKVKFIRFYCQPGMNAATASQRDANANIDNKNVATLMSELYKDYDIQLSRKLMSLYIKGSFSEQDAEEYLSKLDKHEIYVHDESHPLFPYCAAITMQPFICNGLTDLGGESKAPLHLDSFCGGFVNLVFAISCQFAGAIATPHFLACFDYFCRKDYGEDYLNTHTEIINNHLQHVVYALNQPAAARGYQCVFFNISIFDSFYASILNDLVFQDGSKVEWHSLNKLQKYFLSWFNAERTKALLTFPVVTVSLKTKDGEVEDQEYNEVIAKEFSEGNSFFVYMSDDIDSLSSCCRLRNSIEKNAFSYTLGGTGVSTGSIKVITINMNRLVQDGRDLKTEVQKIHRYLVAFRKMVEELKDDKMLSVYDAGFIHLQKQYLTVGINGMLEAYEYLCLKHPGSIEDYKNWLKDNLKVISEENRIARLKYGYMFNTEFVPAENLGVKNAQWDKRDGYFVSRDTYNSYFYPVEVDDFDMLDKFDLYSKDVLQYLDGGSALHLNLEENLNYNAWLKLLSIAAKVGCNYWTYNVRTTICNDCKAIDKRDLPKCSSCGSENVDHATRVIGYLKRESSFSKSRQDEARIRFYHKE